MISYSGICSPNNKNT